MSVNYDLTAVQVIGMLGYNKPSGDTMINEFEHGYNINMPASLSSFLRIAYDCPMLSTCDLKVSGSLGFLYEEIETIIEERKEEWEEDAEWREEDDYYKYSKIPKESWHEYTKDYLILGSDYGAGVVTYGICKDDMDKEDPPLYLLFEDNEPAGWELFSDTLSSFLMMQICYVLLGIEYDTAKRVLIENGWNYRLYEGKEAVKKINAMGIDIQQAKKQLSWDDRELVCGYDEETKALFIVSSSDNGCEICVIDK